MKPYKLIPAKEKALGILQILQKENSFLGSEINAQKEVVFFVDYDKSDFLQEYLRDANK